LVTAVAGGNATITVTTTDGSFTATCAVTVEVEDPGLLTPPALTADTTDNTLGQAADITFPTDAAWEAAISGITVNGTPLAGGQYTISPGNINIAAGVFAEAGDYSIVATATGYEGATVTQGMQQADAPVTYSVTVDSAISGGAVAVDPVSGSAGDTVTVTVTPDEGKQLVAGSLKYNAGAADIEITATEGVYSFVLPAADVTVTARFEDSPGVPTLNEGVYELSTADHLLWFANRINTGVDNALNGKLMNDIDLTGVTWIPIGTNDNAAKYAGVFDGNGRTITLSISGDYSIGLFAYVKDGTVKDLSVDGSISGGQRTAGIVATAQGTAVIKNCVNKGIVSGASNVGGIAGYIEDSTKISGCVNKGSISGAYNVGGIAGIVYGIAGSDPGACAISSCANTGAITATDTGSNVFRGVGGIAGCVSAVNAMIDQCSNSGTVEGSVMSVGGVAGSLNAASAALTNSCNTGNVTSKGTRATVRTGGVAGSTNDAACTVQNTYNAGSVTGNGTSPYTAGVIGYAAGSTNVGNNYYLDTTATTGLGNAADNAVSKTSDQLKALAPTLGEYFKPGSLYPILTWQPADSPETYTVTVADSISGGSVAIDPASGNAGTTITVTVTPDEGKQLKAGSLQYTADGGATYTEITATNRVYSFVLPAADVVVTARFEDGSYTMWSGAGTEDNPYQIKTAADLAALAEYTNNGNTTRGVYWALENDIDLSGVCSEALGSWTPIGNKQISTADVVTGYAFLGDFNGNGHSIQNLYVSSLSGYLGLFGAIGGNDNHDGTDGYGVVRNFILYGSVTNTLQSSETDFVGGICGVLYAGGTISDVVNYAAVQAPRVYNVGGIAGFAGTSVLIGTSESYARYTNDPSGSNTSILRCANHGAVSGDTKVGGMVGQNAGAIKFCYNTGKVEGSNAGSKNGVGGIAGRNGNNNTAYEVGTIDSCYNTGEVGSSAQKWVGGIVGFQNAKSPISNCYNIGTIVPGAGYNNPIVGQFEGTCINNYSLDTIYASGASIAETGVRLTETQFKDTAYTDTSILTLLGNGFVADTLNINNGYPIFRWQTGAEEPTLTGVTKGSDPVKLSYVEGQTFDAAGLVIWANYSDGAREKIANYTISKTAPLETTDTMITVSGTIGGIAYSYEFPITVAIDALTSINVKTRPDNCLYAAGETFNPAGMVVTATYTNGTTVALENSQYTFSPNAALTPADTQITISYTYKGVTKTVDQPITVLASAPPVLNGEVYELSTADHMLWFANQVNICLNTAINGKLLDDIDLSSVTWTPIGINSPGKRYAGTFEGNGKTVTLALVRNTGSISGLFGCLDGAAIRNLTVAGSVTAKDSVGGVAGRATAATIENCVNNATITGSAANIGGIVGQADLSTVTGCANNGAVTGKNNVGGIAGMVNATGGSGMLSVCTNNGPVIATDTSSSSNLSIGGIVGTVRGGFVIDQCHNSGAVSGGVMSMGGVAGFLNEAPTTVINSYNTGSVTSTNTYATARTGGVVGTSENDSCTVQNTYNAGTITVSNSGNYTAGVIGYAKGNTNVSNNYYLDTTASIGLGNAADNAVSKTSDELEALAPTLGDKFKEGSVYPILTWQTEASPETYTVNVDNAITGGSVAVNPVSAAAGETITVTVTP
ncbi:MAG: DUF1533 domain-containing protein, partial [Clostridiaceae bacterium]|nr:DUF1533 domain-containing protein [Clostridiaceae bacterium]